MINMIKADLYRVFRSVTIYFAMIVSITVITYCLMEGEGFYPGPRIVDYNDIVMVREVSSSDDNEDVVMFSMEQSEERSTNTRATVAYNLNLYAMVLIVLAFLVSDLSEKTVKNTLSSAISRKTYFFSKFLLINVTTFIFVIVMNIYTYYMGNWLSPLSYTEPIGNIFKATAYQMPILLGTVSMIVLLGVLTKKSAIFIVSAAAIMYVVPNLIMMTYYIYEWEFLGIYSWKYQQQIIPLWLAAFPPADYVLTCAVIGVCEIAASGILGYLVFKKTDV